MKRLDRLKAQLAKTVPAARENPMYGLPLWVSETVAWNLRTVPYVICGTGHWAVTLLSAAPDLDVLAVVDDYHAGKMVYGRPCLDTNAFIELAEKRPDLICINTGQSHAGFGHFESLANELRLKMLTYHQAARALKLETDIRAADWMQHILPCIDDYLALEPRLADEASIEVLYSFLLYHLETDREYLVSGNRPGDSTYFHSGFFDLSDNEVYVDCGSYDGDSVRNFVHATKGKFNKIYAFEPDPSNFERMQKWLGRQNRFNYSRRIELKQEAVGNTTGTLRFNQTGGEGACVPMVGERNERLVGVAEGIQVPAVRLDEAVKEPMSLLKLDVEGHELAILHGATHHLKNDRPRIASCAYHLPGDLIDLPRFIEGLGVDYQIGLRHHSNTRYDTVLYAF